MSWIAVGSAAVSVVGGAVSANQQKGAANRAAAAAAPYSVSSPFGSVTYGDNHSINYGLGQTGTDFSSLAQQLGLQTLQQGYSAGGNPSYNAGLAATQGNQLLTTLGNNDAGLAQNYFAALQNMGASPQDVANNQYQLLSKQAAPGNEQAFNTLQQKLFSQGRLGTSGGGVDMQALMDSQAQADLGRQISSQQLGLQAQSQLASLYGSASGSAAQRVTDRFNLANNFLASGNQLNAQTIQNAAGLQGLYNDMFAPLLGNEHIQGAAESGIAAGRASAPGAGLVYGAATNANNAYTNAFSQLAPAVAGGVGDYFRNSGLNYFTPTAQRA